MAPSLNTLSARVMLAAMIEGKTDARVLADMAKGEMRRKMPDLAQALEGHFNANHAQLARSVPDRLERVDQALAEIDATIKAACQPWAHQIELLQTIPGVGPKVAKVAKVIVAETGADMSQFPSAAHLVSWAGLSPATYESAGNWNPAGRRRGNKWLPRCSSRPRDRWPGCTARTASPSSTPGSPGDVASPRADRGRALDPGHGLLPAHAR